jgi:hypothetical protein
MPADVSNFLSSFKTDLARPNRYDVFIPIPIVLAPFYLNTAKNLNMRCEATEMPGRTFATTERKIGSAPVQKVPYQTTYNDVSMTFIVSGDMSEKLFFDQWMEYINPSSNYNFRYKADYSSDIAITQYDQQNNITYKAVLIDAYPLVVNQLDLDWTNDGYHKLTVVFAYTNWQEGTISAIGDNLGTQALAGTLATLL